LIGPDIKHSAARVGLQDTSQKGWYNGKTGELFEGVVVNKGDKVVDIGCGEGAYIRFCSARGADVTFVDIEEGKVRALEERLKKEAKGQVKGIVSDSNPIPLEDGCADIVICTEVIEHVPDPSAFLSELVRLGHKDTTYVITVPDSRSEYLIKDIAPPQVFEPPNHIHIFTASDFDDLITSGGLEIVRKVYLSGFWSIWFLLKWSTSLPGEKLNENVHPATYFWSVAWEHMINHPNGARAREALDKAVPKSQMVIAKRK